MTFLSRRLTWLGELIITIGLVGNSFWLELHDGIAPCALCSLQRLTFILLGIFFLIGVMIKNNKHKLQLLLNTVSVGFGALGIWFAGRQVWLQWNPPANSSECGVSLQYLLKILPIDKAFQKAMNGSTECSRVAWSFMNLSLAEWSFLFFMLFLGISFIQIVRTSKR